MIDLAHLPGGGPDEKIVLVLRRHWFTLIPIMLTSVAILLAPPLAYFGIRLANPAFFRDSVLTPLFVLGLSLFILFAILFLYQQYLDYYLDTWIVTDQRILNIEQHGLFARTVSELRLFRVQDVTAEVHGFIHTMFNYGDVHVQTAGETQRFEFEEIEDPNRVAKVVLDLAETQRKRQLSDLSKTVETPSHSPLSQGGEIKEGF